MKNENTAISSTADNYAEVLNDLLRINYDRIEGYKRAIKELRKDSWDLNEIFTRMIGQSEKYALKLRSEISAAGKDAADDTTLSGKIYRAWMDVKASFSGDDRKSVLESCEGGEDAAQRAYESALKEDLSTELFDMIKYQQTELKEAHDEIKALRDRA